MPGDQAFDNTAMLSEKGDSSGRAVFADLSEKPFSTLQSITICGWYKTRPGQTPNTAHRIVELQQRKGLSVNLFFTQKARDTGSLRFVVGDQDNAKDSPSHPGYASLGEWVFFAVTYDGTKDVDNVTFYAGSPDEATPLKLVSKNSSAFGSLQLQPASPKARILIGNRRELDRGFIGFLDEFRIYGSATDASGALSQEQLNSIRGWDLKR
jgi:hypothetical protein